MVLNSFNPCFSGRYSATITRIRNPRDTMSFNPCFSGRYSATGQHYEGHAATGVVSILVLVEGTLQLETCNCILQESENVSILVLVEGTLQQ